MRGNADSSDIEDAAIAVHIAEGNADFCGWCSRQGNVCGCLAMLQDARAVARRAAHVVFKPLVEDIDGFETQVDLLRRYVVKEIRDWRIHGDNVAVEKCRIAFLFLCDQGINAAGEADDRACAAMLQRQRKMFNRALSDGVSPLTEEEFGLLPSPPVASKAELSSMSVDELMVGAFLEYAAEGTSFYEAIDFLLGPKPEPPSTTLS